MRQQSSLQETLAVAPIALANITHSYNPATGALSTRSNLSSLTDPTQFCALLTETGVLGKNPLTQLVNQLGKPIVTKVSQVCSQALSGIDLSKLPDLKQLLSTITGSLGGGLGGILGGGGSGLTSGGLHTFRSGAAQDPGSSGRPLPSPPRPWPP